MKLCITVRGGIVEDVWSDDPAIEVTVVDWDAWEDGDVEHILGHLRERDVVLKDPLPLAYDDPAVYYYDCLEDGEFPEVEINRGRYPHEVH